MAVSREAATPNPPRFMKPMSWSFALEFTNAKKIVIGQRAVEPDWEPAREAIQFSALRRELPVPSAREIEVAPLWDSAMGGEPYATGVRVTHADFAEEMPIAFFSPIARRMSAEFVEQKLMEDGEHFTFRILAFAANGNAPSAGRAAFAVTEMPTTVPIVETDLDELRREATASGGVEPEELPAFLPASLLDEVDQLTHDAVENETGGILLGHLCRDRRTRVLALHITGQVPASATRASSAKLTFTAETWSAASAAIALRGRNERMLGTWHSHPAVAWCAKCPLESQKVCKLQQPFFSEDDVNLHRTVFPQAFCVALVITHAHDGMRHGFFGWSHGVVAARGFSQISGRAIPAAASSPTEKRKPSHAKSNS